MSTANKIGLIVHGQYDEAFASGICKPGHLLRLDSDRKVLKSNALGKKVPILVAKEDELQGYPNRQLMDAYAVDDLVPFYWAQTGDVYNLRLPANAAAVVVADPLIDDGAGCVVKASSLVASALFAATAPATALVSQTGSAVVPFDVSYSIPANSLRVGDLLRIRGAVLFANASNSTETVQVIVKVGTVTIVTTAALDNAAADIAVFDMLVHVRAIGASGSILAVGAQTIGPPASGTMKPVYVAPTTLDTTAAAAVTVNQVASASHANTGGQLTELTVEKVGTAGVDVIAVAEEAVNNSAGSSEALIAARIL